MANSVSNTALVLIAVVPVVTGAVLTALFTWLAQRRIDKREHARWVRERRYETYQAFLTVSLSWNLSARLPTSSREEDQKLMTAMWAALENAQAIASVAVYDALENVVQALADTKTGSKTVHDLLAPISKQIGEARKAIRAELTEGS